MNAGAYEPVARGFTAGNRLQLLRNGEAYFPALIAAIDRARHEVHLETYIFADDATGRSIAIEENSPSSTLGRISYDMV